MIRAALVALAVLVAAAMLVAAGFVVILQVREQSVRNQLHFDCAVSVFAQTDPPKCREVKAEFVREGIFPSSTTTVP